MSHTISIEEAASQLAELIGKLGPGDEIVLTADDEAVARIIPSAAPSTRHRKAGNCRGMLLVNEEDDAHLEDFEEYMP
jgi:antitoxin (DNA-binding transcriptional repressor) of toxin-antitoxin stability system